MLWSQGSGGGEFGLDHCANGRLDISCDGQSQRIAGTFRCCPRRR
jgi:hypothetical protein